jgi:hypothetical protein
MSKRAEENIVAAALVLIFVAFLAVSMEYGERARMIPIPVSIASLILIGLQIFLQNFRRDFNLNVNAADIFRGSQSGLAVQDEVSTQGAQGIKVHGAEGGREAHAIAIVVLFMLLILLLGIIPAIFIYVAGYFIRNAKIFWVKALVCAGIADFCIYALFGWILKIFMYKGWIYALFWG